MSEAAPSAAREILVVDDDPHTRNLLRDLCESLGFTVHVGADGDAPLELFPQKKPDLVLLDVMMPKKDGFTVLQELRAMDAWRNVPIIILTANAEIDGKIRGMELGADDYVTKPFKLLDLQTRINSALLVRDYRQKLSAAEDELGHLRALDPLTGAGTYSQLKASLDGELARSRRYGRPAAALLFGFDDYQGLRFQLGREKSDAYVAELIAQLRAQLRGADRLFRLDVDEFVALLPETDQAGAGVAAARLLAVVNGIPTVGREGSFQVKVHVGTAAFPHERIRSSEDLLREANRAYRAARDAARR